MMFINFLKFSVGNSSLIQNSGIFPLNISHLKILYFSMSGKSYVNILFNEFEYARS